MNLQTLCHPINFKTIHALSTKGAALLFIKTLSFSVQFTSGTSWMIQLLVPLQQGPLELAFRATKQYMGSPPLTLLLIWLRTLIQITNKNIMKDGLDATSYLSAFQLKDSANLSVLVGRNVQIYRVLSLTF